MGEVLIDNRFPSLYIKTIQLLINMSEGDKKSLN